MTLIAYLTLVLSMAHAKANLKRVADVSGWPMETYRPTGFVVNCKARRNPESCKAGPLVLGHCIGALSLSGCYQWDFDLPTKRSTVVIVKSMSHREFVDRSPGELGPNPDPMRQALAFAMAHHDIVVIVTQPDMRVAWPNGKITDEVKLLKTLTAKKKKAARKHRSRNR